MPSLAGRRRATIPTPTTIEGCKRRIAALWIAYKAETDPNEAETIRKNVDRILLTLHDLLR